jgi:hypothetical protein
LIAENLTIQITKALNAGAEKTGDLERIEGNLLERAIKSARGSLA